MHLLFVFGIFAIILPNSLTVHPGDPFPTDLLESKIITAEDLINQNQIIDPNDDEIPTESTTDLVNDEENSISVSTKSMSVTNKLHHENAEIKINLNTKLLSSIIKSKSKSTHKSHDNDDSFNENSLLSQESSTLLPVKCINKKNLIQIGRWKHEDLQTKTIRYWYEPEGGHMGTGWVFDGFIFQAYNKSEPDTEPVYAFHSEIRSIWTNTIQMDPKSPIIGNDQWIPDGVSFYAYRTSLNSTELRPVLRYWNKLKPGTTDATETRITYLTMNEVIDNNNNEGEDEVEWTFDNILFYVLPIAMA